MSVYHEKVEVVSIGQHPKVCQLLSAIFNKWPSQPKYIANWDISKVMDYIDTLGNDENLSIKIITLKLTTLLAIISSSRASELTYLGIRCIAFKENLVIFHFSKLSKTWKKGKSPSSFWSLTEILKRNQGTNKINFETKNQLWIIQWKFCQVNSFVWVALNFQYYIDWDFTE